MRSRWARVGPARLSGDLASGRRRPVRRPATFGDLPPDDAPVGTGRADRLVLLAGVVLLAVLTGLQVLPAPARWGTHVNPNDGDPVLITWILEHQARALLHDPGALYRGNIFFPEPAAIAWSDNLSALVPVYLLVWLTSGRNSVLAYNTVTFLAFAGSSLAVLVLARRLLDSSAAAVVAAVAFTLSMVRRSAIGHTQLAGFLFMPLALVLLMDVLDRRRARSAVLAGACLAGLWYTATYFFVLAVVAVPAFVVAWALTHRDEVDRRLVGLLAATALTTALLIAPSLPPYLELQGRSTFERGDDELLSIGPAAFTQPPSLLYRASGEEDGSAEGTDGFVGWTVAVLAVVALVATAGSLVRRRPDRSATLVEVQLHHDVGVRRRRFAVPLGVACAAGALLALGPDDGLLSVPYRWLRPLVPGLESARVLSRFWIMPALGLALLAGRGLDRLVAGRRRLAVGGGALAVALLVAELFVRPGSAQVDVGDGLLSVNQALERLEPGVVTELPVPGLPHYPYVLAVRQLRSLEDGLPRVEGYSGDAPAGLAEYLQATSTFPAPAAFAALRQAGVRHVVLHGAAAPCASRFGEQELAQLVAAAGRSPEVAAVEEVGESAIITLVPEPVGGPLSSLPSVTPTARSARACRLK